MSEPYSFRAEFEESPLDFGMDCSIVDQDGCIIELTGATPDLTRHIVKAVNYYDRLREALRDCMDCLDMQEGYEPYESSRALLAELDNLEKQQ